MQEEKLVRKRERQQENQESFEAYGEYRYDYQPAEGEAQLDPQALRRAKKAHQKRQTHGFFKFLFLLCILTVGVIVAQETLFRLETVYVVGNELKTPQQVVMASGLVRGRNMLGIEEEEVAGNFKRDHTLIFRGMQKEYPGTIYLYIEERKTVAAMQWLGILYTLDPQGMVMDEDSSAVLPQGIPVVTGFRPHTVTVGQPLSLRSEKQLEAYKNIMSELDLQMYNSQVSEINLADPENLYLVTAEGVTVRLGDAKYMQAKIGAVRTDMAYLRQLGKKGGILDVTTPEDAKYMPENER